MTWTIRPAEPSDRKFLEDMLYEAAMWRGQPDDRRRVLNNPHVATYLSGWGRPGDTAIVATDGSDRPIGAAWFRSFSKDEPGYGFIDENVPELSIAVVPTMRGRGVGAALVSTLIAVAEQQGLRGLSLSVESDNPAVRLYERLGFRTVSSNNEGAITMLVEVGPHATKSSDPRTDAQ